MRSLRSFSKKLPRPDTAWSQRKRASQRRFRWALAASFLVGGAFGLTDTSTSPLPLMVRKGTEAVDHVACCDQNEMAWFNSLQTWRETPAQTREPLNLQTLLRSIQAHTMSVPESLLDDREQALQQLAHGLIALKNRGLNKHEMAAIMLQLQGPYNGLQASSAYLVTERRTFFQEGVNCYGRFDLLAELWSRVYPEDRDHLRVDSVMNVYPDGRRVPHTRLLIDAKAFEHHEIKKNTAWYIMEGERPQRSTIPPSHNKPIEAGLVDLLLQIPQTDEAILDSKLSFQDWWEQLTNMAPGGPIQKAVHVGEEGADKLEKTQEEPPSDPNTTIGETAEVISEVVTSVCPEEIVSVPPYEKPQTWMKRAGIVARQEAAQPHAWIPDHEVWFISPTDGDESSESTEFPSMEILKADMRAFMNFHPWDPDRRLPAYAQGFFKGVNEYDSHRYFPIPPHFSQTQVEELLDDLVTFHHETAPEFNWLPIASCEDPYSIIWQGAVYFFHRYTIQIINPDHLTPENVDRLSALAWTLTDENAEADCEIRSVPSVLVPDYFNERESFQYLWMHMVTSGDVDETWDNWFMERGWDYYGTEIVPYRQIDSDLQREPLIWVRFYDDEQKVRGDQYSWQRPDRPIVRGDCRDEQYLRNLKSTSGQ